MMLYFQLLFWIQISLIIQLSSFQNDNGNDIWTFFNHYMYKPCTCFRKVLPLLPHFCWLGSATWVEWSAHATWSKKYKQKVDKMWNGSSTNHFQSLRDKGLLLEKVTQLVRIESKSRAKTYAAPLRRLTFH